jgi:hypothetical protein
MTVEQLAKACGLRVAVGGPALEKSVTGGFCGDLLSWVMSRAHAGDAWITVMGNENAVAVAVLSDVACVILAEDAELDARAASRAAENGVAVLKGGGDAFGIAIDVASALGLCPVQKADGHGPSAAQ